MPRTIPKEWLHAPSIEGSSHQISYQFDVLTTRYGGGVLPGVPDETTPFRVPEIKGALRFWWRAVRGGEAVHKDDLLEREGRIWGSSTQISPTAIGVEDARPGLVVEALKSTRTSDGRTRYEPKEPAYVFFPAQQRDKPGRLSEGGSFTLSLAHQSGASPFDVEAALWAWTNFGGYGARTRRGAGALFSPQFSFPATQREWSAVRDWLAQQAGKYLARPAGAASSATPQKVSRPWPVLAGAEVLLGQQALPPEQAWLACIRVYRDFRQSRNPGSGKRPGRSRWPEPDQIRRERRTHHSLHRPAHPEQYFPRAIFGLPIVFHFNDGDPKDQTLYPSTQDPSQSPSTQAGERMVSPIILKPLIVARNLAFPMIVRLNWDIFMEGSDSHKKVSNLVLKQKEASELQVKLGPRRADEEFLRQVEENLWRTKRFAL